MSTQSAKSSIHKRLGNAAKRVAFLAYPFLVFGWLALASSWERRFLCIAALCAIFVFIGAKILRNLRLRGAWQRPALRELLSPALAGALLVAVLLSGNEHFFKLYPILISGAALAYFAHSLAFPPNVVEKIARRLDRDFSPEAVPYTRNVARAWCAFFAFNIAASAASALLSWEIWCFYNGFLSYCIMGTLFVGEFFVRKRVKNHLKTGFVRPSLLLAEGARVYENEQRSRAAFICKNGEISFPQFCGKVARLAHVLRERKETHCAISCDDSASFSVGFFAALCAGKKILLPQSLRVGILAAIEKFDPLFLSEKPLPQGAVPAEKFIRVDSPFLPTGTPPPERATEEGFSSAEKEKNLPAIDRASEITFFSSGSTGTPKEIRKTWANIEDEVLRLNAFLPAFPRTGSARVLATVKCGHLYGLLYACVLPLCRGASVDAERVAFPEELSARSAHEANALWLVSSPAFLSVFAQDSALLKTVFKGKSASAGTAQILSSASPLARETSLQIFNACALSPLEVYGTTECGGIAYRKQTETQNWTRWPDVEISLRGDACELCVRTPLAPDFSTPVPVGDAAEIFPDKKTFRLLGRTNRMVKFQDNRLSLDEVEQTLAASPLVAESFFSVYENSAAATPGAPSAQKTLCALVALSPEGRDFALSKGVPALSSALKNFLRSRVEPFAVPKKWRYAMAIPRNEQSKISAEEIRSLFSTKLQEPLVENLQLGENSVRAQLTFLPGAVYFRGHFPSLPLLPGVVQLCFAERFAKKYLLLDVAGTPVSRLKFKAPIFPASAVQFSLEKLPDSRVKFSFSRGARLCSSGYFLI